MEETATSEHTAAVPRCQPGQRRCLEEANETRPLVASGTHAGKSPELQDACNDQCSEVTCTFPAFSSPSNPQRPGGSRPPQANVRGMSDFGAPIVGREGVVVRGACAETTPCSPEPFATNHVWSALRSLVARLFRRRDTFDNSPRDLQPERTPDDKRAGGAVKERTRTYSETTLLHGKNKGMPSKKNELAYTCGPSKAAEVPPRLEQREEAKISQDTTAPIEHGQDAAVQTVHGATAPFAPSRLADQFPGLTNNPFIPEGATGPVCEQAGYRHPAPLFQIAPNQPSPPATTPTCMPPAFPTACAHQQPANAGSWTPYQWAVVRSPWQPAPPPETYPALQYPGPQLLGYDGAAGAPSTYQYLSPAFQPAFSRQPAAADFPHLVPEQANPNGYGYCCAVPYQVEAPGSRVHGFDAFFRRNVVSPCATAATGSRATPAAGSAGLQTNPRATSLAASSAQTGSSLTLGLGVGTMATKVAHTQTSQVAVAACTRSVEAQIASQCTDDIHTPTNGSSTRTDKEMPSDASRSRRSLICWTGVDPACLLTSIDTHFLPPGHFPPCFSGESFSSTHSTTVCTVASVKESKHLAQELPPAGSFTNETAQDLGRRGSSCARNVRYGESAGFKNSAPECESREDFASPLKALSCPSCGKPRAKQTALVSSTRDSAGALTAGHPWEAPGEFEKCLLRSNLLRLALVDKQVFSMPNIAIAISSAQDAQGSGKSWSFGGNLYPTVEGRQTSREQEATDVGARPRTDSSRMEERQIFRKTPKRRDSEPILTRHFRVSTAHLAALALGRKSDSLKVNSRRRRRSDTLNKGALNESTLLGQSTTIRLRRSSSASAVGELSDEITAPTNASGSFTIVSDQTRSSYSSIAIHQNDELNTGVVSDTNEIIKVNVTSRDSPATNNVAACRYSEPPVISAVTSLQGAEPSQDAAREQVDRMPSETAASGLTRVMLQVRRSIQENEPPPLVSQAAALDGPTKQPFESVSRKETVDVVDVTLPAIHSQAASQQTDDEFTKYGLIKRPSTSETSVQVTFRDVAEASRNAVHEDGLIRSQLRPNFSSCSCQMSEDDRTTKPALRGISICVTPMAKPTTVPVTTTTAKEKPEVPAIPLLGTVRYCKNPRHRPKGKLQSSNFCMTCKNPKHNHGYPGVAAFSPPPQNKGRLRPTTNVTSHDSAAPNNIAACRYSEPPIISAVASLQGAEPSQDAAREQVDRMPPETAASGLTRVMLQVRHSIQENELSPLVSQAAALDGTTKPAFETVYRKETVDVLDVTLPAIRSQAASQQTDDELTKYGLIKRPSTSETSVEVTFRDVADALGDAVPEDGLIRSQPRRDFSSCSCWISKEGRTTKPAVRGITLSIAPMAKPTTVPVTTTTAKEKPEVPAIPLPGTVSYCKNPRHRPTGKLQSSNFCITCKNPKHNHGYPGVAAVSPPPKNESRHSVHDIGQTESAEEVKIRYGEKAKHGKVKAVPAKTAKTAKPAVNAAIRTGRTARGAAAERPVFCYLALAAGAVVLLVILVYFLVDKTVNPAPTTPPPGGIYYCATVFCDREADRLKSLLSRETGPCDDFYKHVCDRWVQSQRLLSPETGAAVSSDTIIQDQLIAKLESYLTSSKEPGEKVALALYNACADQTQAGRAFAAIGDLFRRWTIGQWPTAALTATKDVWSFAGELLKDVGLKVLVDVFVAVNPEDPDQVAIGLGKPSFLFSCNDAARPAVTNMFQDALVETMTAVSQATNQQLVDEVIEVMTRLGSSPLEPPVSEIGMRGFDVVKLSNLNSGITHLLRATLDNGSSLTSDTKVVLKSADFVQGYLVSALRESPPRAVMNYAGFLVFINLAPFFLDRHRLLRQLFSKSVLGRTLPDVSNTGRLCLVAVERVLPGCFARMSRHIFRSGGSDGIIADKLSQLATSFGRNAEYLAWVDDMVAVLSRYLLKNHATSPPPSGADDDLHCPSSSASFATDNSVRFFVAVSRDHQQRKLGPLSTAGSGKARAPVERSQLSTLATYDAARRRVHVPAALFNTSVPANTSHFSLHFARFAVRFYRALVEALLHRDAIQPSLRYGDDLQRRFQELLGCFEWELRQLPAGLRQPVAPDSAATRGAFLQQTVAVQMAFRAFQELLQIRRTWNMDFRFAQLPDLSGDQLFFVYYALDNCEAADRVYQEHRGNRLPARYRVNVPLRNTVEFRAVFACGSDSDMARVSFVPACTVVAVDRWGQHRSDAS